MSTDDLHRLRADLDTMQQALGVGVLPFGWTDVWLTLGLVPTAALTALWVAFGPPEYLALGIAPFIAWATFVTLGPRSALYRPAGQVPLPREVWFGRIAALAFALGLLGLVLWEKSFGLPYRAVRGAGFILAGILSIPLAASSPARRYYLGILALAPMGALLPLCATRAQDILAASAGAAGAGLLAAGIMAWQLRHQERP